MPSIQTSFLGLFALLSALAQIAVAFPAYGSLAGLSGRELEEAVASLNAVVPGKPPGAPADTSTKLVYDSKHPFVAPGPRDIRGPCPGLNTLANHGVRSLFETLERVLT